eukprot:comp24286_c0_seq1/m.45402 comp24286_c0_seq1/g.45402  ORF comp24286_c0_seq1/g.45402 comp24286_c0_seq1/m.45402 type:complete len:112 (-) comp24286_c0_seq1:560-895(-)
MVQKCNHALCSKKQKNGVPKFVQIKGPEYATEVFLRVGRTEEWVELKKNSKNLRLCRDHFDDDQFENGDRENKPLKPKALPRAWSDDVSNGRLAVPEGVEIPGYNKDEAGR